MSFTIEINRRRHIFRRHFIYTNEEFATFYKGHDVNIERDERTGHFSIHVRNPEISFGTAYDGYADESVETMEQAIKEALIGSGLALPPLKEGDA